MTVISSLAARPLSAILVRLADLGVIPAAAAHLDHEAAAESLRASLLAEIEAFALSANPDILPAVDQHVREHAMEIARLCGGGAVSDFAFVRDHAERRAEQHFPLEVLLHAYRLGHRVFSQWLRQGAIAAHPPHPEQAVAAVADFAIEYTNVISIIAASHYVARSRALAEAEGDRRTELLSLLLTGYDESDGRVAGLLRRAGYLDQRQAYCVVAVQPTNLAEMDNPERSVRIIAAITRALAASSIRVLAGVRGGAVIAIASDRRRQSGWTAPDQSLAARLLDHLALLGPVVLVGLSGDHPSTAYLPRAHAEALTALDLASVDNRVVAFARLPVRSLLIHRGGEQVRAAPPAWAPALVAADPTLLETLRAIAKADMNVHEAARLLGKHPNTLYARLERIAAITGLNGRHYGDLTEMLLAADCLSG
ncbi:MAG: PucR family transcriptional regulator [Alphaproteobacteria bacterium]|nr:PucR family transcriptional regulator [Alphaproteobacteria bacterium]